MILTDLPSDIVAQLLIDGGIGNEHGSNIWPVGAAEEPSDPDNCITVFDTEPQSDGSEMVTSEEMQHDGIQVRVRSSSPPVGQAKMAAIANFLSSVYNRDVVLDGGTYLVECLTRTSGPISLGKDVTNTKRNLFTLNLIACITPR